MTAREAAEMLGLVPYPEDPDGWPVFLPEGREDDDAVLSDVRAAAAVLGLGLEEDEDGDLYLRCVRKGA